MFVLLGWLSLSLSYIFLCISEFLIDNFLDEIPSIKNNDNYRNL